MLGHPWDASFDPIHKYARFAFLPPYVSSSNLIFGYLTLFIDFTFCLRPFITILKMEKETFFPSLLTFTDNLQILLKVFIFLSKRKSFEKFFREINNFLEDNRNNPVFKEDVLLKIWKNNQIFIYAKWYTRIMTVTVFSWIIFSCYVTLTNPLLASPLLPYYSPYYSYNLATKWTYTIFDNIIVFCLLFSQLHIEIVFLSFLNFLLSLFSFLKISLDEINGDNTKLDDEIIIKWWLRNHIEVIRFVKEINQLFGPIVAINFICHVATTVFCIVFINEVNLSVPLMLKIILFLVMLTFLFITGYGCSVMENINEVNRQMHENVYRSGIIFGKKANRHFLKMVILISQRPIRLRGLGFFTANNETFMDLVFRIYSFYSSLVSLRPSLKTAI